MGTTSLLKRVLLALLSFFALVGVAFTLVWVAMEFKLLNVRGSTSERNSFFTGAAYVGTQAVPCFDPSCEWQNSAEWSVVRAGLQKDSAVINRVASETGVPARIIAAAVIPEQLRFFTSEREMFKQVFEPLKILGSMSQFSLGVSGIKQETAIDIERRLLPEDARLITYPTNSTPQSVLFERLTDPHDHYYSYLYTALFIKEVSAQWAYAGTPISNRPAILATLFNIGFENSHPNPAPQAGGAIITVNNTDYPFGTLAGLFYDSNELVTELPK